MAGARGWLCLAALLPLVVGCGDPPPRQDKKLAVPKGESTLDELIKKSQEKVAPPPSVARIDVNPGAVDFSNVAVGETAVRQLLVSNAGESPASISQIHLAGQASAFRLGGNCVAGGVIAAKASCGMEVTFRPLSAGPVDAEVVLSHSGPGGSVFTSLSGQATGREPSSPLAQTAEGQTANARVTFAYARARQDGGLSIESDDKPGSQARVLTSLDYNEAGLPGIVSTFPVDRTRVITADRYIPAVLENTINSQLPGRAIAVVERPVYGSEGRAILIPAGSRVIGRYQSLNKVGEARLSINWSRILRPDGVSINIDDQGADVMGRTGLPGDLDDRFVEKYGSSLLTSVIAAAGDWALDGTTTTVSSQLGGTTQTMDGRALAANRLGNDLDRLGQRMVTENVDIRPVLTVPQGTRLNIIPSEDIWLRDPDRIQAVTPVKGTRQAATEGMSQYLPGLIEFIAQNPSMQRLAPQTAQQIMQSNLLQQLRDANLPATTPATATGQTSPATTSSAGGATARP